MKFIQLGATSLTPAQKNWSILEIELLGVIWALEHSWYYGNRRWRDISYIIYAYMQNCNSVWENFPELTVFFSHLGLFRRIPLGVFRGQYKVRLVAGRPNDVHGNNQQRHPILRSVASVVLPLSHYFSAWELKVCENCPPAISSTGSSAFLS